MVLFVGFRWPVNTILRMGVLEAQDGVVVGVVWPLPSGLASCLMRILIEHLWPHPCNWQRQLNGRG